MKFAFLSVTNISYFSDKGSTIKSSVLKCVCYREFGKPDLIEFPLLDSNQANRVPRAPVSCALGPAG